jgi:hypothetical protein
MTRIAALLLIPAFAVLLCAAFATAQSDPLPLGAITPLGTVPCVVNSSHPLKGAKCIGVTVDCTNIDPGLTPLVATLAISTPATPLGTIFLHAGGYGTAYLTVPNPVSYAQKYLTAGYQVVQIAWEDGWQSTYTGAPALEPIAFAACRPATVLYYVYKKIHGGSNGAGAMCAQGDSAGSAATAYSLAMYGSSSYLDNVLLTDGPVYSDVQQGCQYPNIVPSVALCAGGVGCDTQQSWTDFPQFLNKPVGNSPAESVAAYTIPGSNCNNWQMDGMPTTSAQNMDWQNMSVTSSNAMYNYPQTSLRAFLCGAPAPGHPQNNSAAQGWLFYQNFIPPNTGFALNFLVHRIDNCPTSESPWYGVDNGEGGQSGFIVSMNDMLTLCQKNH